jgi:hydroxypyruvate isomerase
MRIKQAVCWPIFDLGDLSLDDLFRELAAIGYPAVEFWQRGDQFEHIAGLARKYGLRLASMAAHHSITDGLNRRSNHDRIEREIRESIELAASVGMPGIIAVTGNAQPHQTELEAIDAIADGLRRVAPYAEAHGVNVNIEMLNVKVDHPGYAGTTTAFAMAILEKVNSPRVKMVYDIYHMQIQEGDIIRTIRDHIPWIGHFHTGGVPGRHEPDETQELNYRAVCRAIAETGYNGYVGHEYVATRPLLASLRQAFEICDVDQARSVSF